MNEQTALHQYTDGFEFLSATLQMTTAKTMALTREAIHSDELAELAKFFCFFEVIWLVSVASPMLPSSIGFLQSVQHAL